MFPFVSEAHAQGLGAAPAAGGDGIYGIFYNLFPFIVVLFLMWFLVFRPQQKKMKAQKDMLAALEKGDKVKTDSGIHGTVVKMDDDTVVLEVGHNAHITLDKFRVAEKLDTKAASKG